MKEKLRLESNGYALIIREDDENYKTAHVRPADFDDFEIHLNSGLELTDILKEERYEDITFKIQTVSFGSQTTDGVKEIIEKYQRAVNAVEYFQDKLAEGIINE